LPETVGIPGVVVKRASIAGNNAALSSDMHSFSTVSAQKRDRIALSGVMVRAG
jgi:hypothetical protein